MGANRPDLNAQLCLSAGAGLWVSDMRSLTLDAILYAVVTEMPPSPIGAGLKVRSYLQVIIKVQADSS